MTTNPGEQSEVREPMGHKSPVLDIGVNTKGSYWAIGA